MLAALFSNLFEAPREIIVCLGTGLLMWGFGIWMGARHVVKPARRRHEELLHHHEQHAHHLRRLVDQ